VREEHDLGWRLMPVDVKVAGLRVIAILSDFSLPLLFPRMI